MASPNSRDERIVTLGTLTLDDEPAFRRFAREYAAAGDHRYTAALDDFPAFLARLGKSADRASLLTGKVPWHSFWLRVDGELLGGSRLRLELNEDLRLWGGNIGYDIRPSERRRGFGTRILFETLGAAAREGLDRVLITCDAGNLASKRILEKNGGRALKPSLSAEGRPRLRFEIEVPTGGPSASVAPPVPRPLEVRPGVAGDRADIERLLTEFFGSISIVTRGRRHELASLRSIVCRRDGALIGVSLSRWDGKRCEMVALAVVEPRRGIGRRLVAETAEAASMAGLRGLWLVTTDNNDVAQVFCESCGFRKIKVHENAVEEARVLEPEIPTHDARGRPIRDEIEFDLHL